MSFFYTKENVLVMVLVFVVLASGVDLYMDVSHGASTSHIVKEAAIVVLSAALIAWMLIEQRHQAMEIRALKKELAQSGPPDGLMSEDVRAVRKQLSDAVSHQFEQWRLTTSEREVGWLLLKGLSLKEISAIRETLEKTVRQQASSIYRKAGLSGRHAFSAWFVEDLL